MSTYNILVLDDMPQALVVYKKILESSEDTYNVKTASNGADGLSILHYFKPDLIISDWDMPNMNGIEFISQIRLMTDFYHIPVIMITGMMVKADDLKMAFDCGASDFLRKPFDKIELLARIRSMLLISSYSKEILESKKRALTASALRNAQLNELNGSLLEDLNTLFPYLNSQGQDILIGYLKKYKVQSFESSWKEFELRFENVYEDFYQSLLKKHPNLTVNEKRLSALLRIGLNSKEIADLTFQDAKSVDMARYRLRKKLGLSQEDNLTIYLSEI